MNEAMSPATRERHATLLAGLNEAPSALIGWDVADRKAVRLRGGELIPVSRYRKLDGMWWALKGGAYAEKVRTDQATRYHALTGRTLPDPHLRRAETALERFAGALQGIADAAAETVSKIAFPRLKAGELTTDDFTKGA